MLNKNYIGYIGSRNIGSFRYPQSIQNLIIREFANKNNFNLTLSNTEYAMENCFIVLNNLLKFNLKNKKGIVFFSHRIFFNNLKEIKKKLIKLIKKKKQIHFALENISIKSTKDIDNFLDIKRLDIIINETS